MLNNELLPEQIKLYRKILIRHLKDNNIYSSFKKYFYEKFKISFGDYLIHTKGDAHFILNIIDTIWQPITLSLAKEALVTTSDKKTFSPMVTASNVIMGFVTDKKFLLLCKSTKMDNIEIDRCIDNVIRNEVLYLFTTLDKKWGTEVSLQQAEKTSEIIFSYKDGRYLNDKVMNCLTRV